MRFVFLRFAFILLLSAIVQLAHFNSQGQRPHSPPLLVSECAAVHGLVSAHMCVFVEFSPAMPASCVGYHPVWLRSHITARGQCRGSTRKYPLHFHTGGYAPPPEISTAPRGSTILVGFKVVSGQTHHLDIDIDAPMKAVKLLLQVNQLLCCLIVSHVPVVAYGNVASYVLVMLSIPFLCL